MLWMVLGSGIILCLVRLCIKLTHLMWCRSFAVELNNKLFHNTFGYANDDAGRAKGLGADYADRMFNIEGIQVGLDKWC